MSETERERVARLLQGGSAKECITEANRWLAYYLNDESGDLEPIATAQALNERALLVIDTLMESLTRNQTKGKGC